MQIRNLCRGGREENMQNRKKDWPQAKGKKKKGKKD